MGSRATSPTRWLDEREQGAWLGLQAMSDRLAGALGQELQRDAGVSWADYAVLVALTATRVDRLRVHELADELGWEKSRLSHHLTRMARRGLVVREACGTDGRGAFVVVTATGRAAVRRAAPAHVAAVRELFIDALSPEQLDVLGDIGTAVLARLAERR